MTNDELLQRTKLEVKRAGSVMAVARATGEHPGTVHRVLYYGGNSPTLRRIWKIPKHTRRTRLTVSCTQETIERYDAQRGDMSRREWLERLIDLGDGIGEVI